MNRKQRDLLLKRIGALVLIFIFVFAGLLTTQNNTGQQNQPAPSLQLTAGVIFPTVPPGGTTVTSDFTYFHSSAVISLPHLVGWDPASNPNQPAEEKVEPIVNAGGTPAPGTQISRVGVTFINGTTLSVVHAFAERDPERKAKTLPDLDAYYNGDNLKQAWANFTGGYKELNRRTDGNLFIINFELYLDTNTYLGRQVSRLEGDWLMVLRLVAPNNNPQLLDQLQNAIAPQYQLWTQALNAPISWSAIADYVSSYVIKYPPDWRITDGSAGRPFTVSGTLGADSITLTTRAEPGKSVKTEADAQAWVKANISNATVQTVKADNRGDTPGFSVAYSNPDPDGNQRSAVVTLLNGANNTLYVANLLSSARGQNLLDTSNTAISPDLAKVRDTFFLIPTSQLVPTLTPSVTPPVTGTTPAPAITPTTVPATAATTAATLPATVGITATIAVTTPPATSAATTAATLAATASATNTATTQPTNTATATLTATNTAISTATFTHTPAPTNTATATATATNTATNTTTNTATHTATATSTNTATTAPTATATPTAPGIIL
ncbi:MAG: hypothetical protein IT324_17960 [Anaerolineae bacterium]|nr:hypothetical protein [Anaerolineae bacterium]